MTDTDVTVAELRTPQQPCDDFVINREKLGLLEDIHAGRVRRTAGGVNILTPRPGISGYGSRVGNKILLLWAAGLAVLGDNDIWKLTGHGIRQAVKVRGDYDLERAGAGR